MYTFTDWKDYRNKGFYWKMVIKSNKTIVKSVDPTTSYLAAWDFTKRIIPLLINNEWGEGQIVDLTDMVLFYVRFYVSMNKKGQRLNMLWPIV